MKIDTAADLDAEDETGFVWTFLDEASDPSMIRPGEVVHRRILPGSVELPNVDHRVCA